MYFNIFNEAFREAQNTGKHATREYIIDTTASEYHQSEMQINSFSLPCLRVGFLPPMPSGVSYACESACGNELPSPAPMPQRRVCLYPFEVEQEIEKVNKLCLPACLSSMSRRVLFENIVLNYWNSLSYDDKCYVAGALPWCQKYQEEKIVRSIEEHGLLSYLSSKLDIAGYRVLLLLGKIFKIDPQKIFETYLYSTTNQEYIEVTFPPRFITGGKEYKGYFVYTDCRKDENNTPIYSILRYSADGEEDFFALCSYDPAGKPVLGRSFVRAHFFFFSDIAAEQDRDIILFLDSDTSIDIIERFNEAGLYNRTNIFVSGFFGGNESIEKLDFLELADRNIVLVPSCHDEDLSQFSKWLGKFEKESGAKSIRVYPWLVSKKPLPEEDFMSFRGIMAARAEKCDYVQNLEIVSSFISRLMADSLSLEEYRVWREKLSPKKEQDSIGDIDSVPRSLSLVDLMEQEPEIRSDLSWDGLITGKSQTLLWGESNSGKSTFSVSLALTLSKGGETFGLKANRARKVLYLDGEAGPDGFREMSRRFNPEDFTNNFRYLYTKDFVEHSDRILRMIDSEGIEVVFLDNILSICRGAIHSPGIVTDFGSALQTRNVALVTIHHAGKNGTTSLGKVDLESLSKNVFRIHKGYPDEMEATQELQELVITLQVTKWKKGVYQPTITAAFKNGQFCVLGGRWTPPPVGQQDNQAAEKSQALDASTCAEPSAQEPKGTSMLPSEATTQEMEPDSSETGVGASPEIVGSVTEHPQYKPSANALLVLNAIKDSKCQATRKYLEESLKLSKGPAHNLLQELEGLNLIEQIGKGKSTYYVAK